MRCLRTGARGGGVQPTIPSMPRQTRRMPVGTTANTARQLLRGARPSAPRDVGCPAAHAAASAARPSDCKVILELLNCTLGPCHAPAPLLVLARRKGARVARAPLHVHCKARPDLRCLPSLRGTDGRGMHHMRGRPSRPARCLPSGAPPGFVGGDVCHAPARARANEGSRQIDGARTLLAALPAARGTIACPRMQRRGTPHGPRCSTTTSLWRCPCTCINMDSRIRCSAPVPHNMRSTRA